MSEALFRLAADGRHDARSAGSEPAERLHPEVTQAMRELGVDLAGRVPRPLDPGDAAWAEIIVTMGCGDACPVIPGKRYLDWALPDPAGRPLEEVRAIRDDVRDRIEELVRGLDEQP